MGQNLGYVPPLFVLVAGAVILVPWLFNFLLQRKRELALTVAMLLAASIWIAFLSPRASLHRFPRSSAEGESISLKAALNCHTQFCASELAGCFDVGPTEPLQELRQERPLLIGNRRQGPDLAEVGGRTLNGLAQGSFLRSA